MTQSPPPVPTPASPPSPAKSAAGIAGAIGGGAVGLYCGFHLLVPAILIGILLAVFNKTALHPRHFRVSVGVIVGHVAWMMIGVAFLGNWGDVLLDLVILGIGLAWLIVRPGLVPVILLIAFSAIALVVNALGLAAAPAGSLVSKALVVHCLLRLLAITCLILEYRRMTAESSASAADVGLMPTLDRPS